MKANNKQYILQLIASEQQLETFLRLRYDYFFKSGEESSYVPENHAKIDLNYYDRNANHYGLYLVQNGLREPVGYFRIILEQPTKADIWICNIARRWDLAHLVTQRPAFNLPCLRVYTDGKLEHEFFSKKQEMEKVAEAGRLLIVERERSLKLSLQLIKSALAIAALDVQHAFVRCSREHSVVYSRLGFRQYPEQVSSCSNPALLPKGRVVLYCKSEYIPGELKPTLYMMQTQYVINKYLTFQL